MQTNTFSIPSSLSTRLFIGTAGVALFAASSASAQQAPENCNFAMDGTLECQEPGDTDRFPTVVDTGGGADGAYDNLDSKIEQTAPSETDQADAQTELDTASDAADTANETQTAIDAALSDENRTAYEALETAEQALVDAETERAARDAALMDATDTFDDAADALTAANLVVTNAQSELTDAQTAAATAQATFDADQSADNLAALNTALAERDTASDALDTAEDSRDSAIADANSTTTALTEAQTAANEAQTARDTALGTRDTRTTELDTSLAANQDLVDAITALGLTADAAGVQQVADNAEDATTNLASKQAQFDSLDDTMNTFVRARDVLVPAAENPNAAIAAASQALLGDPRAAETNSEIEVIAALVDHETRITDNTAAIITESEARAAGDAELLEALTAETNSRIAAIDAIESRLSSFDDRISSSTATAIALGGMAFLPDMKFNLAVSGGFYEGAQAVAANIGYRLNDNTAITAGIGGGLNKNGKVGGRVGVIFGW